MRKLLFILTALCLCILLVNVQSFARDTPTVAKKLVAKVKGKHNHPDYYTGKHGFMNDDDLPADNGGPLEKGLYIMSWLVLDPPLCVDPGQGGAASITKDLYKEAFGISEEDVTADPKNWPIAGQRGKAIAKGGAACEDYVQWIPINFQDLEDAGQGRLFASGNEFDWLEWGGTGLNDFHEYLFCLVKWNKTTKVQIKVGSDDPEQTWVNGKKVAEGLANRNWTADTDLGEFEAKGGEWVAIMSEVGERGGEMGYTIEVQPPPDDHTLDIEMAQAVNLKDKLAATWGYIKAR